jgi:hypothetical protein
MKSRKVQLDFLVLASREVRADLGGGDITSDAERSAPQWLSSSPLHPPVRRLLHDGCDPGRSSTPSGSW